MEKTCFITVTVYQSNFKTATTGFMIWYYTSRHDIFSRHGLQK